MFGGRELMDTVVAYIGLGSNLGNRSEMLMIAIKMIDEIDGIEVKRISQFIQTEPVGGPEDQGKYINAAAELETTLSPEVLLEALGEIETFLGRDRANEVRWGPRTCDLDILMMGDLVMETDELTIPHPRMHERRFVLEPLTYIAGDVVHPVTGKTIRELLLEAMMK